ncbi:MAG: transglutaminase domain-containing protein, partial [Lachnospiraceae bacterium]|nr:transglutaminase domain-containing protein [Lachnospiraceae bacterium]
MKKRRFSFGIENMGSLIRGGYQLVYVLLLAGIILSVLGSYLGIKKIDGISVFVLLSVSLFVICLGNGRGRVRMFPVVGLFSALALTMLSVGLHNAASFLRSYIYWALNAEGWNAQWVRGYELLQHVYVAVGAYLLVRISHRDFRIKAGIALLCLGWLAYSLFTKKALSQAGVVLVVILLVIILSEWVQRRWEKVRRQGMETYIFWLLPFLILYTVLLLLMPAPEKPYDWQFAKDAYGRLKETAKKLSQQIRIGKGDTYDFAFSGFSENSGIGAGIVSDDREMMVLKSDYGFMTNIYLIGKVYDTFDGKKWTAQSRENGWDRYLDTAQTLYAAERFDKQYTRDYISRIEFTIRLSDLRSRYVLAPLKTWSLQRDRRALVLEPEGDNLLAADIMSYGVEYDASYYQLNAGSKIFADFLSADLTPDEEILGKILSNSESRIGVRITPEDLTKHEERVYVHYMGKSALSDEAEAYLREMTKDAKSLPEELKSIEEELSSFTYTKTPGEYPQEIDSPEAFLDYFLLRSRQGYCNHFATAFVLLAREKGIPARYVQGFCVPAAGKKEVTVYSHMAHAWPEVYLDGIGWIPFEPTPGFARIRYTPWKLLHGANRSEEERDTARIEEA